MTPHEIPILGALYAAQPRENHAAQLQLYGRFVGSWTLDIDFHPLNGPPRHAEGEWHFAWVLEGNAIQDVWIFPARRLRGATEPWHMYGTTFRWYDPVIDAWHIRYFDPGRLSEQRQLGRASGHDIVQTGEDHHGVQRRWRFVEITNQSFRWIGDVSCDQGMSWTLEMEMRARRIS
ncbi:MAG: hypothetical protein ACYCXT_13570 [Acidiferrobacteraceae bacterium]